jgi:hypothetical protein
VWELFEYFHLLGERLVIRLSICKMEWGYVSTVLIALRC